MNTRVFLKLEPSLDQSYEKYDMHFVVLSLEKEPFSLSLERVVLEGSSMPRVVDYVYGTLKDHKADDKTLCYVSAEDKVIKRLDAVLQERIQENKGLSAAGIVALLKIGHQTFFSEEFKEKGRIFEDRLRVLKEKVADLRKRGYEALADKAQALHTKVSNAAYLYFQDPTVEGFQSFKKEVNKAVKDASPELGAHRGYKQLLGNLLLAVLGLGIFYGIAVYANGGLFFKTDSLEKADKVNAACNDLKP